MLNWCKVNVSDPKDTASDFFVKIFELSSKSTLFYCTMHNMILMPPIRWCVWGSELQLVKWFLCIHEDLTSDSCSLSEKAGKDRKACIMAASVIQLWRERDRRITDQKA